MFASASKYAKKDAPPPPAAPAIALPPPAPVTHSVMLQEKPATV
jgi:hypothetical protein